MPKLTIATGDEPWVYEIFPDEPDVTLGRGAANLVQLHDGTASKHHASIRRLDGHWKLIDLESRNGVRVNGRYRNQAWLSDGDTLHIGDVVVQYAAEGAPDGMPPALQSRAVAQAPAGAIPVAPAASAPVVPKPVAPTPAAPKPVALEEVAIPEAAVAPAPVVAATPPPAPAAAAPAPAISAPSRSAPSRRRARDDYDDYDDDGDYDRRPPRRGGSNSTTIALLGVLGAALFVTVMVWMVSPGENPNFEVRERAAAIAAGGDFQGAIDYSLKHGDRSEEWYSEIEADVQAWRALIEMQPDIERNQQAQQEWRNTIILRAYVDEPGGFRAQNAAPKKEIARRCREFLATWEGTFPAARLVHSEEVPYTVFREWMRQHAEGTGNPRTIVESRMRELDSAITERQFALAIRRMEFLKASQALILEAARAQEVRRLADEAIATIKRRAKNTWDEVKRDVEKMVQAGHVGLAEQTLQQVRKTYGVESIVEEAAARIEDL